VLSFDVTDNTNSNLFDIQPAVDPVTGELTFTPKDDAFGSATITVELMDDGGIDFGGDDTSAAQSFTITVDGVNDVPSFTIAGDQSNTEDDGAQSVPNFAVGSPGGGGFEDAQVLSYDVSYTGPALFAVDPAIDASGTLTYTLAPDANGLVEVTVSISDGFDTSATQTFNIEVTAVNDAPSFTVPADLPVLEDTGFQSHPAFAVGSPGGGGFEDAQSLTYQVVSVTGPAIFDVAPAIDVNGDLTFTLLPDAFGVATVTLFVSDDGGTVNGGDDQSDEQTFTITVTNINDEPSFTIGANQVNLEDDPAESIAGFATGFPGGGGFEDDQVLVYDVSSDNPDLFASAPVIDASGTLTYELAEDAHGDAIVTVSLSDGGGVENGGDDTADEQSFSISVTAVNDAPTFTVQPALELLDTAGPQTVPNWASEISAGGPDELLSSLTGFEIISNDNPGLFDGGVDVDIAGTLSFEPIPGEFGTATITLVLKDDGGGEDTSLEHSFTITVNSVNDAPSFTGGDDVTVPEDDGPQTVQGWATDISKGSADESDQVLTFVATGNTNPDLFDTPPAIDPLTGQLTFTTALNAFGTATITFVLQDDGGTDGGGADTSAPETLVITIEPVNDPPTITVGPDQEAFEGDVVQVTASFNDPELTPAHSATIDWGDGSPVEDAQIVEPTEGVPGSITASHVYADNGTYSVTVTVSDSDDASANASFQVSVANAAPVFTSTIEDDSILVGNTFVLPPVDFTDAGSSDTYTATINWGDGTEEAAVVTVTGSTGGITGTVTAQHVYDTEGVYTVVLTITDDDGGSTTTEFEISAHIIIDPPVINLSGSTGDESDGESQHFTWDVFSTDDEVASVEVTIRKSGAVIHNSTSASGTFAFDDLGLGRYTIDIIASDLEGRTSIESRSVGVFDDDVESAAISLTGSQGTQLTDETQEFGWSVRDPSGFSFINVSVTRDGRQVLSSSAESGSFNFDDLGAGEFQISVRVRDGDDDREGDSLLSGSRRSVVVTEPIITSPPVIIIGGSSGSEQDEQVQQFTWDVTDTAGDLASVDVSISGNGGQVHSSSDARGNFNFDRLGLGQFTIDVTATDAEGSTSTASQTVTVSDDDVTGPVIALRGSTGNELTSDTQQFGWDVSDDTGLSSVDVSVTRNGDLIFTSSSAAGLFNFDGQGVGNYVISVSATDADLDFAGDASASAATRSVSVEQDASQTFQVMAFTPTPSGFRAEFTDTIDSSTLNLFIDQADVSLFNPAGVPLRGSLIVDSPNSIAFIATGGVLSPGDYSVVIRSGDDALRSVAGELLDGNGDGQIEGGSSDDYTTTMSITGGVPVVSIPDFARGPGQDVNVPATGGGLPISISDIDAATSIDFEVRFDSTMLDVTGAEIGATLPADWTATTSSPAPGVLQVSLAGDTPVSGTNMTLLNLIASVPTGVLLSQSQVISINNASLNGGDIAATGDQAVHQASYLGDVDGDGVHTAFDASLIAGVIVQTANGFESFASTDPVIIGNVTGTGTLNGLDAAWVAQKSVNFDRPEVPTIPDGALPAIETIAAGEAEGISVTEVSLVSVVTPATFSPLSPSSAAANDEVFSAMGGESELSMTGEVAGPTQVAQSFVDFSVDSIDPIDMSDDDDWIFDADEIATDLALSVKAL